MIEWDIDNNLPVYTADFIKLYNETDDYDKTYRHICYCHMGTEMCDACEHIDCRFHAKQKRKR